ncbi:hypothetical protein NM688_g2286 [Phlebia brevispora]|uniref:Uncharacterized protein n=1 Tax=Phlebia brevispora TaxID=194682 RepID=A0ACC1T9A5_9APHY|nr:hypothetical protein NM688_g2286 [Phlebia brevispora]
MHCFHSLKSLFSFADVIFLLIFALSHVILQVKLAVWSAVLRWSITLRKNTYVLPKVMHAECHAVSQTSVFPTVLRTVATKLAPYLGISVPLRALRQQADPSFNEARCHIPTMYARSNRAQYPANCANDYVRLQIIYTHWMITQYIFVGKSTCVRHYVSQKAFAVSKLPRNPWRQRSQEDMRASSIRSTPKVCFLVIYRANSSDRRPVSKRLPCVIPIPAGQTEHQGNHSHNQDANAFHFCEARCENCGYFCTLPLGHPQQEHETSHGSMSRTRWAVDGPDGTAFEVNGRKFGSNDDGAPMLCSMVCRDLGRHVHIDYCRSSDAQTCRDANLQHITVPLVPNPDRAKDFLTHSLYWRRTGFKDPYSQEDRVNFAKCDAMCAGPEHQADANGPATPSYCNLPMFHPPLPVGQAPPGGIGYVSSDGHHFSCRNPAQLQQAFHVVFVIDRSGSMWSGDRRPLGDTPVTTRIARRHNNRIGAVYSSLYAFWSARHAALTGATNRRDSYSVLLFNESVTQSVTNDFTSTPDALLEQVLRYDASGGTNYTAALRQAQACIEANWSAERSPVVIFLSDGECSVGDGTVRDLCRRSIALGRPLSFHSVAFGPSNQVLRRMTQIANEVERGAPADPMRPLVASSYAEALDSVRLAETFLGIAESLKKPRGALMKA